MDGAQHLLIVIVGPTGSGKSELALHVAEKVSGEIVNCDSLQLYHGFDIGTAKLTLEQQRGIPHHLIDILDPDQLSTAADYAQAARQVIREIAARQHVPIIAGGSGFYLRALLEGLSPGPSRDEALRARLMHRERERKGTLHRILSRLDTGAAARIHPNDVNKTLRALELRLLRTAPKSTLERPHALQGFNILEIGLDPDRTALYERLNRRLENMFNAGLIEDVRKLLASGVSPHAKPFESLGYKEALLVIEGNLTRQQAIEAAQIATRHYAKRQLTWFRRDPRVHWFQGFGDDPNLQQRVCALLGLQDLTNEQRVI